MKQSGAGVTLLAVVQPADHPWNALLARVRNYAEPISERAEAIRQQIQEGEYYVSSRTLARAILAEARLVAALSSWIDC